MTSQGRMCPEASSHQHLPRPRKFSGTQKCGWLPCSMNPCSISESGFVHAGRADLGRVSGHGPGPEATSFTPAEKDQADLPAAPESGPHSLCGAAHSPVTLEATKWFSLLPPLSGGHPNRPLAVREGHGCRSSFSSANPHWAQQVPSSL